MKGFKLLAAIIVALYSTITSAETYRYEGPLLDAVTFGKFAEGEPTRITGHFSAARIPPNSYKRQISISGWRFKAGDIVLDYTLSDYKKTWYPFGNSEKYEDSAIVSTDEDGNITEARIVLWGKEKFYLPGHVTYSIQIQGYPPEFYPGAPTGDLAGKLECTLEGFRKTCASVYPGEDYGQSAQSAKGTWTTESGCIRYHEKGYCIGGADTRRPPSGPF